MAEPKQKRRQKRVALPPFYNLCGKVMDAYFKCQGKIPQLVNVATRNNLWRSKEAIPFLLLLADNLSTIKSVIENVGMLKKFKMRPTSAYIIVGDLLLKERMSERFKNLSRAVKSVLSMQEVLRAEFAKQGGLTKCKEQSFGIAPRWVFVNTLQTTVQEVNTTLLENGFKQVDLQETTYDCFLNTVKTLGPFEYLEDFHLPGLLAMHPSSNINHSHLVEEHKIMLVDKASCLPPVVSGVVPGVNVVDACAAPGNKTILLANLMRGKGRLTAIDRDEGRFKLLKTRLSEHGVKNSRCINSNFTDVPPSQLQGVHTVLVDPSCSNSGVNMHTDERSHSAERSLACMQLKLLCHALSIPGVQTVVYSTCSVTYEENEGVVDGAMQRFGHSFELEDLGKQIDQWKHFGLEKSPYSGKVLRTNPDVDLCHGFFVAKFVAKPESEECEDWTEVNESRVDILGSNSCTDVSDSKDAAEKFNSKRKMKDASQLDENDREIPKSKKIKRKSNECLANDPEDENTNSPRDFLEDNLDSKKEKKKRRKMLEDSLETNTVDEGKISEIRKKKKSKHLREDASLREAHSDDGEVSEGKKERKKKAQEEESLANGVDFVEDSVRETKKEKKKRKKDLQETFSSNGVDLVGEDSVSETKQEKKKKRKEDSQETFSTNGVDLVEDSVCETKKEKRKRKEDLQRTSLANGVALVEDSVCETKKEKRKRTKDLAETSRANGVDFVEDSVCETKKEKKKRRKDSMETFSTNGVDFVEDSDCVTKKEKRKRLKDLEELSLANGVDFVEDSVCETKKEKKKRKKDFQEIFFGNGVDLVVEDSVSETKKEKKKKRNVDSQETSANEVDSVGDAVCETKKAKKKKKKYLQENISYITV